MKKQFLSGMLAIAVGAAYAADNEALERAKDHAQPVPNASVTTQTVTENTVTMTNSNTGTAISTTKTVSVDNSEEGQIVTAESSELVLPPGRIIDNQMDMAQTIETMQSAFDKLQSAQTVSAMKAPANIMLEYAGQASVLLENGNSGVVLADPRQAGADLEQLRAHLIELHSALLADDFVLAKAQVDMIASVQGGFYSHFAAN